PSAMAGLSTAYLVRARETADPAYYSKADALLESAITASPDDPDAVLAAGTLALTRHDFTAALSFGERAVDLTPYRPAAYGVLAADEAYRQAGLRVSNYVPALAGQARVRAALGDLAAAANLYEQAVRAVPLAEYAIALGDVYTKLDDTDAARAQYNLVEAIDGLFAANGVRTDLELAVFRADHGGDLESALTAARSEYALRPSIPVTDALAWVEYRAGDL